MEQKAMFVSVLEIIMENIVTEFYNFIWMNFRLKIYIFHNLFLIKNNKTKIWYI